MQTVKVILSFVAGIVVIAGNPIDSISGDDEELSNSKVLTPLSIQKVSTYASHSFLGIYGIAVLADGSFLVADKLDYKIKHISPKGVVLKEVGKRGKGPAEFDGPAAIAASKHSVAVSDFQSSRVQLFDLDLKFLNEFYVPGVVINVGYDQQENLWVAILPHGSNDASLLQVNSKGKIARSIHLRNTTGNTFENIFNFVVRRDNLLCALFTCQNVLEVWSTEGRFEFEVRIAGFPEKPGWIRMRESANPSFPHTLVPKGVLFFKFCADSKGNLYVVGEEYVQEPQRDVFVLDQNGKLFGLLQLPRKSSLIYIDSNDYLWSVEEQRTRVSKYKFVPLKSKR